MTVLKTNMIDTFKLTCGNCGHVNEVLPKDILEYTPTCYHCGKLMDEEKEKEGSTDSKNSLGKERRVEQ
jgi:uncharacterized Zn finger protein